MKEQGSAHRGGTAFIWKWGVICGVVLGMIQIIIALLLLGRLKTILDLLVWLIGFFVLCLFAARQTGRVRAGALVGLVTGLIGALIGRVLFDHSNCDQWAADHAGTQSGRYLAR